MQVFAFIAAIVAAAGFCYAGWRDKSLTAFCLGLLTTAWIVQVCVTTGTHLTT